MRTPVTEAHKRTAFIPAAILALLTIAGVCYSSWLLEFFLATGVDQVNSFLSAHDVPGEPYRAVFQAGDLIAASLCVLAAVAGLWFFPRRLFSTVGWVAVACFGVATIFDAQSAEGCIPTPGEPPCAAEPSVPLPQLHNLHALTSTVAVTSMFVAMVAWLLAARRYGQWPLLRTAGFWILVATGTATIWMGASSLLNIELALGIAQRIQIAGMSLWLITLGVAVWREPVQAPGPA